MRVNPKWHSKPAAVEAEARFKLLKGWEKKKAVFISKRRKCMQYKECRQLLSVRREQIW